MTLQELDLCDVQGDTFQLAVTKGYDPMVFVDAFLQSKVAAGLDSDYNRLQWSGEVYVLHRLEEIYHGSHMVVEERADLRLRRRI